MGLGPLPPGKQCTLIDGTCEDEVIVKEFSIDSDSVQAALYVGAITGSVDVKFYTVTNDGELEIIEFPTITAPLGEILLRKAAASMSKVKALITCTGSASINLVAKAINAGESSVVIEGADNWRAVGYTVGTTPGVLISAALVDRRGLAIRNLNNSGQLYIAETLAKVTGTITPAGLPDAFILKAGESIQIDITAGSEIYAVGEVDIDVRTLEVGE